MACKKIAWFTSPVSAVGIGVFEDQFDKRTIRISAVAGIHEGLDATFIEEWGANVHPSILRDLLESYEKT